MSLHNSSKFFWLIQELAETFGQFQMDWRELGVPRRGGVIVESFNADEVDYLFQKWVFVEGL